MLLKTKLFAPRMRDGVVTRPHLLNRLGRPAGGGISLVQAPAGYGKTTLVRQWLAHLDLPFAWLSLDEQDNEMARFWRYITGALRQVVPAKEQAALHSVMQQLTAGNDDAIEDALMVLVNQMTTLSAAPHGVPRVLVLDDFHVIENRRVLQSFSWFLDQLPVQFHVAMTSRSLPDLAMARRRVRNQIVEINTLQLNFLSDEIQRFFTDTMHQPVTIEASEALREKTGGWIAGVQLAAIFMQQADANPSACVPDFSGSHHYVVRYLDQEVLLTLSPALREFLLICAVLPRFSQTLCDALLQQLHHSRVPSQRHLHHTIARQCLDELERQNLFLIALDDRGEWSRLHHFFAEALLQIAQKNGEISINEIHLLAATWFETQGYTEDALHHLFCAEHWERAADVIEKHGFDRMMAGHNERLEWWLQQLPENLIAQRPRLCLIKAWGLFATPQVSDASHYLDIAERHLLPGSTDYSALTKHIAIFRTQLARIQGDTDTADRYAAIAFDQTAESYQGLPSAAQMALGLDAYATGDLDKAVSLLQSALSRAKSEKNCFSVLAASMVLAQTYFQQGYSQRGLIQCDVDRDWLLEYGQDAHFVACWQNLVRADILRELQRDTEAHQGLLLLQRYAENGAPPQHVSSIALIEISFLVVDEAFDRIEPLLQKIADILDNDTSQYAHFTPDIRALRARYAIRVGDFASAEAWALEETQQRKNNTPYNLQQESLWRARVFSHRGDLSRAMALIEASHDAALSGGCTINVVRSLIVKAIVLWEHEHLEQAVSEMSKALALAGDNYRRVFLDEGKPVLILLEMLVSSGVSGWWQRVAQDVVSPNSTSFGRLSSSRLSSSNLLSISAPSVNGAFVSDGLADGLRDPLTRREVEILKLIATGMSNQQIADHLHIAMATTKVHVSNIFDKFDVNRRTHALAKARALKIIE